MKFITSFLLAILVMYNTSLAQSPEAKGLEIAKLADQADQGFESTQSNLKMILRNKQGQETTPGKPSWCSIFPLLNNAPK